MSVRIISSLAIASILIAHAATASAQPTLDDDAARLLRAIDTVPSRAQLEQVFDDAPARLIDIASDPRFDTWTRTRALTLTSHFAEPRVAAALLRLCRDRDEHVRAMSVYTLARTFGEHPTPPIDQAVTRAQTDRSARVRRLAQRARRFLLPRTTATTDSALRD